MKKREALKIILLVLSTGLIVFGVYAVATALRPFGVSQFIYGVMGIVSGIVGVWLYFTKP